MKSLKFISLIMLCATSSLALVLPALGVVSFPEQLISSADSRQSSSSDDQGFGGDGLQSELGQLADEVTHRFADFTQDFGQSVPVQYQQPYAPPAQYPPQYADAPPSLFPGVTQETAQSQPQASHGILESIQDGFAAQSAKLRGEHKVGTGIWLLLGPVWVASLVLWTVAPTPRARKR